VVVVVVEWRLRLGLAEAVVDHVGAVAGEVRQTQHENPFAMPSAARSYPELLGATQWLNPGFLGTLPRIPGCWAARCQDILNTSICQYA